MKLETETYKSLTGQTITRHYLNLEDGHVHSLTTRHLWQLTTLAIVELGKQLRDDEGSPGAVLRELDAGDEK